MKHSRHAALGGLALAGMLTLGTQARAASLQQVSNWGANGVPSTASMYIYVPDQVAANPPILVVAHYCGGTASAVFGQVRNAGIVSAADQYGFIMVVPQTSENCWDVGSTKALTHDGGGDTHAVAQMVRYAITEYQANADRVYITGDSSGAMMTEAMLAVYPDIFKGGSEFAGVPAGCWAVGNPDGSWSSQCAGGQVTHTAQEWGDLARAMYPGYMGHRPRVQLVHGDADTTINYKNHTEGIKQWTDLLGLSTNPTSTDTVTLGQHQATRQRWTNSCGYVVLEAYTSMGGDHGPSDALFNSSLVIPFLGLDKTDAVDPEIAECGEGSGGMGGAAGMAGTAGVGSGGAGGLGGVAGTGTAGEASSGTGSGGDTSGGLGGAAGLSSAGATALGGTSSAGVGATGGVVAMGGASGVAGAVAGMGSNQAGNGTAGGATGMGGSTMSQGGNGTSGTHATGGGTSGSPDVPEEASGCSCEVAGRNTSSRSVALLSLLALALVRRRRDASART